MTSMLSSSTAAYAAPLGSLPNHDAAAPATGGGDALAAMRPAMDTAFAIGRPTDANGAAAILGTGGSYLQGASATLAKLDEGIARRTKELEQLRLTDPEAAQDKQGQLDLLQRLRDRIQLSIERVGDILAGTDRDDVGDRGEERRRLEHLELLEQRRRLLAPDADVIAPPAASSAIAGTYARSAEAS